jgi:hypothetical protein
MVCDGVCVCVCVCVCEFIALSACLSVCLSACLFLFIALSACLFLCIALSACLSVSVYRSFCLCVSVSRYHDVSIICDMAAHSHGRSQAIEGDKKLVAKVSAAAKIAKTSAKASKAAEVLHTQDAGFLEAEGVEKTYHYTQDAIRKNVDVSSAAKVQHRAT